MAGNNRNPSLNDPRSGKHRPPAGIPGLLDTIPPIIPAQGGLQQTYIVLPMPPPFTPSVPPPLLPSRLALAGKSMSMSDISTKRNIDGQPNRDDQMQHNSRGGPSRGRGGNKEGGAKRGGRSNRDRDDCYNRGGRGNSDRDDYIQRNRGGGQSRGRGGDKEGGAKRGGHDNRGRGNYDNRGGRDNRDRDDSDYGGGRANRVTEDYDNRGGQGNRDRDDSDNRDGRGNRDRDDSDKRSGRRNRDRDDSENRDGRGNRDRDDYDKRSGRGNRDRDDYDNRGGRVSRDRDDYYDRGGRGNRGRDDSDNGRGRGNRDREDYEDRGGRGNNDRDDSDNRGGRGKREWEVSDSRGRRDNRDRDDSDKRSWRGNRDRDDYDNRGGQGNRDRDDSDNRGGRSNRVRDDSDNRSGRENRDRDDFDNRSWRDNRDRDDSDNRGGRGNRDRGDSEYRGVRGNRDRDGSDNRGWRSIRDKDYYDDRGGRGNRDRDDTDNRSGCDSRDRDDSDNRGGRGNRDRDDYDNRGGRGNRDRDDTDNRSGYGRRDRDDSDNRGGRGNRDRHDSGNRGGSGNRDRDDYDNRRGRGNRDRDDSDNRGGRVNRDKDDSDNRGGRGNRDRDYTEYSGVRGSRDRDNYDDRGGRGDWKTDGYDNRGERGDSDREVSDSTGGRGNRGFPLNRGGFQCRSKEAISTQDILQKNISNQGQLWKEVKEKETSMKEDVLKGSNNRLDDIKLVKTKNLRGRLKRYRKKIAELEKDGASSTDLTERYNQISEIENEIARRIEIECKGEKNVGDDLLTGSDDILHHDDDEDDEQVTKTENTKETNTRKPNRGIDSLISRLDNIIAPRTEENQGKTRAPEVFDTHAIKSKSAKETDTRKPDVDISNEMFNFVVKMYQGKGRPDEIRRESGFLHVTMDAGNWFKFSKRFTTIERNGKVTTVFAFFKDISYCLDYIKKAGCSKPGCERFHVCKDMLCGNCIYGDGDCKFSHNLLDERNMKIADGLGLSKVFSSEEICSILCVRYPHVCHAWNETGTCSEGESCPDLHLCADFVLNKCNKGPSCPCCHDRETPHNKPIVTAFKMETWQEPMFKRMLYLKRTPKQQTEPIKETPEEDFDGNVYLCHLNLVGNCERRNCDLQHSSNKLPYLWQVQMFGNWKTLEMQEDIEKHYCNCSNCFTMTVGAQKVLKLWFEPEFKATVVTTEKEVLEPIGLRRITTASYKDEEDGKESYKTQWRWHWQDDDRQWQLFEPDTLQHTLEAKYLFEQEEYLYARENYKLSYTIDFKAMSQINMTTDKMYKLRRRPLYVSKQDVQSETFLQALVPAPSIDIDLPDTWVPLDIAHPFELVKLSESCPEYTKLRRDFYRTLEPSEQIIDHVYRVQNHSLWNLFCSHEKTMKLNAQRSGGDGSVEKRSLFHGTDSMDAVRGISINNFDFRLAGRNATMYGNGAYFAVDAKYSHLYTKGPNRFMFQAQVLVGEYTLGNKNYKRPPNKPGKDHELYDSCVDNEENPKIFIVAEKNQYYPEYLIQYHDAREM